MRIKKKPFTALQRPKTITATQRLPLWKLDDEMYMKRQIAPSQNDRWLDIKRTQVRMKEMVAEQQKEDMREMERELTGFRLEPKHNISDLRQGMWLEGRVSGFSDSMSGVWVDVGAYTETGEWVDGYVQIGQIREDGAYIAKGDVPNQVHLGELVRVRVRQVTPGNCTIDLSMRSVEDLPPLFLGKQRTLLYEDLEEGMPLKGVVRRVWSKHALVDIGCDRLAWIHVREHPRRKDSKGFEILDRKHKYAPTAFPKGAVMNFFVKSLKTAKEGSVDLQCTQPRHKVLRNPVDMEDYDPMKRAGRGIPDGMMMNPPSQERLTEGQRAERERAMEEKKTYEPYVPYVNEWLETAMEPDEDQDSWVARTESELFEELSNEAGDDFGAAEEEQMGSFDEEEDSDEDFDEAFADDEFAEDDFVDGEFNMQANPEGFGDNAFSASELDGWDFDESSINELEDEEESGKLTDMQVEALFDGDDDYLDRRRPETIMEQMKRKEKEAAERAGRRPPPQPRTF